MAVNDDANKFNPNLHGKSLNYTKKTIDISRDTGKKQVTKNLYIVHGTVQTPKA